MSRFAPANDEQGDEEWRESHKDDPVERVREPVDNRSLFEKLQEQKAAKEDAYNEATKFSNLIRRLDNDEIDFLVSVREQKQTEDERKKREQDAAIDKFRTAQKTLDAAKRNNKSSQAADTITKNKTNPGHEDSRKRRQVNVNGIVKRSKFRKEMDTTREDEDDERAGKDSTLHAAPSDRTTDEKSTRAALVNYDSESD